MPAERREALFHLALEIVFGPAEQLVAGHNEFALLGAKRFSEALPFLRMSVAAFAEYPGHYNTLISCRGHLGLISEAQEYIAKRNSIGPALHLAILRTNLQHFAHRDVFIDGMKKAGVPE